MKKDKGITLFVAIVIMGTISLVSVGMVSLAARQNTISFSAKESQEAFYASDTGLECALYWDIQNPTGNSAFATSTTASISCGGQTINNMGGVSTSTINLTTNLCASIDVNKKYIDTNGNGTMDRMVTTIESKGYNTCNVADLRRVERAVRATY